MLFESDPASVSHIGTIGRDCVDRLLNWSLANISNIVKCEEEIAAARVLASWDMGTTTRQEEEESAGRPVFCVDCCERMAHGQLDLLPTSCTLGK